MTRLAIRVLGPFEVSLDGEPVTHFETLKTRALLAYLATRSDQPHRREFLSEMLWPDRPQGATRANLRHTLRSLRLAIGDYEAQTPFLRVTRETIQLSPDGDSWVDVRAFAESLAGLQGIGCPEPGQLERAIGLVRGAFLEGVSLADSAVFEEWAALKREQVRRNALNVLARLAEHHEQRGEYEQALPHAWRQVDLEPWDETAHQQVMRLLARSGHRAQALAQYETLCRLLADELGAEPMAETRMLFAAICSGELGLEPALRSGPPVPVWNLPASPTPFFGRRDELSILEERLADPHARPLTLTGPGGSGKTRLALEAGTRLAEGDCRALADGSPLAFPHGAVFVPLAAVDAVEALVPALADALPLALELAASWADALSLTDILAETQRSLDFLQAEVPDLPARQRSMRVVFDTAWQRLSAAERALFTQLSVLRGGYTRESAKLVAGGREPTLHLLASLVRKSFVQVDQTRDRYHLHVLLRQYGAAKLAQEPAREAEACDRHSRHFCGWLGPRGGDLRGGRQKAALAEIGIGLENVRAACVWAAAHGRADRINQASYPLGLFYCLQGTLEAGDITLRTLAERLSTGVGPMSGTQVSVQWAMARLCLWRSVFASHMGDRLQSTRSAHEALDSWTRPSLLTRIRASNERSSGRHWATPCATPIRQRPGCASAGRTKLYQEIGDRAGMADALEGLGRAARNLRDLKAAEDAVTERLRLRQDLDDEIGAAESMALLGHIALWQGEFDTAEGWLRQYHGARSEDVTGHYLSHTLLLAGRFEEASISAAESTALYLDLGQRREAVYSMAILAQCYQHLGDSQAARAQAEDALSLAQGVDFARAVGMALGLLGAVALAEGAYEEACARCEESLAIWHQSVGHPSKFEGELACLALAAWGMGQGDEAWQHLRAQLAWAQESQMLMPALFGLVGVARLLADEGETERAAELHALASTYPFVANSRWFEDVAGKPVSAMAATLPAAVVTAARERGLAQDPDAAVEELLSKLRT